METRMANLSAANNTAEMITNMLMNNIETTIFDMVNRRHTIVAIMATKASNTTPRTASTTMVITQIHPKVGSNTSMGMYGTMASLESGMTSI